MIFAAVNNLGMTDIVRAGIKDIDVLVDIGRRSLLESHGHSAPADVFQAYLDAKVTHAALQQELADPHNIFHIIYDNHKPAGYSKIIYSQPVKDVAENNLTKMERLYLLEEYHGLQLGHLLLQHNISLSLQQGEAGMWLYVWKENERALRFYEREGFVIIGDGWFPLTAEHANPNWQMLLRYERNRMVGV
ncbi:MAG: GNAT family N-acetyltransferase [Flavisolibacter sp.]